MLRSLCRAAALAAILSTPALAQAPCHAENDGNNFNNNIHMGGPNLTLAIKFTAPASITVNRMEVFTGEGVGNNSLTIWSHNGTTGKPGAQLSGQASWALNNVNSWQGGNLSTPFALIGGTTYWLGWKCLNISQASVDLPLTVPGQPYCASTDSGTNWAGPFQSNDHQWKFRFFCSVGSPVTPFCFGDGTMPILCPCTNLGNAGHGCNNSAGTGGAHLTSSGATNPDTLVLTSTGELPAVLSIVYQADQGSPFATFGDGIRCLAGNQRKLYVKHAVAGMVTAPAGGDPSITARSTAMGDTIPSGATRHYQVVYRDRNPTFCPIPSGSTFNVSNGLSVIW